MTAGQLFAACVAIWGSTWIAITWQLGTVAPEASVFWRFLAASALLFAYCAARGLPLRFPPRQHAWIALQGVLMFSTSYVCVYHAERYVVSGLVAVGYSASPLLSMVGMRIFFGTPMTARVGLASLLGIVGIALVFQPEFARVQAGGAVAAGAAFTVAAVLISTFASLAAHRNHEAGVPIWQNMAWGMLYGAIFTLGLLFAQGGRLAFEPTLAYGLSLAYLAVFGSILAFASFLHLLAKVGAARAGYIGVMVPIVALGVSSLFEGYRWTLLSLAGVALSVAGNVIILRRPAAEA
ncbi:MAG TPA: EamA family transporter [Usitatibacteraceae bacterium]|nr:EamA family transporter [Usitatibacteraceae bacterium]